MLECPFLPLAVHYVRACKIMGLLRRTVQFLLAALKLVVVGAPAFCMHVSACLGECFSASGTKYLCECWDVLCLAEL